MERIYDRKMNTLDELKKLMDAINTAITLDGDEVAVDSDLYGSVRAVADFNETVIRYYGNDKDVSAIVFNKDLVDDKDSVIAKVAEFFANY